MNRFLTGSLLAAFLTTAAMAEEKDYLKAFPEAKDGMKRAVIRLPHKERGEEDAFRVELRVGKKIETDGVNQYFMGGEIKDMPLEGWGFTYYEVKSFGPVGSTRIGVPPGTPTVEKLVTIPTKQIRYNSRIPIVVYVPEDGEVQYRVWTAPAEFEPAGKE
jgi:ecotin